MTKPQPKRIDTVAEVAKAHQNLDAARQRVNVARKALADKRDALAVAVTNWQALFPKPTQREMIAAVNARNAERERVAREIANAEPASHLDAVLKSGVGGNCNFGYRRPRPGLRG